MRLPIDRQLKQSPVDQRGGCVDGGGQQDERDAHERLLCHVLVLQPPVERRAEVRGLLILVELARLPPLHKRTHEARRVRHRHAELFAQQPGIGALHADSVFEHFHRALQHGHEQHRRVKYRLCKLEVARQGWRRGVSRLDQLPKERGGEEIEAAAGCEAVHRVGAGRSAPARKLRRLGEPRDVSSRGLWRLQVLLEEHALLPPGLAVPEDV
mmetsp:Transcript_22109/g.70636  ORF Transcript_22109/g.70636 Transcript_22109/m.70636 type:complete len:212 (+) Transcript_22109:48-683(+)